MCTETRRKPPADYQCPPKWQLPEVPGTGNDLSNLKLWVQDMVKWGERVRDDIIRLEAAARTAPGDPGDPPPEPE